MPDLEFASRYVPGEGGQVGGDWYDVFELPSARLCVVVGDVVGRGLTAAVTMGRLRSVLRAYALQSDDPAEILRKVDRSVRHFEPDVMATALCAMVEPPYDEVVLSSAGHPPPVLARPGRDGELARRPGGPAARGRPGAAPPHLRPRRWRPATACSSTPTGSSSGGASRWTSGWTGSAGPCVPARPRRRARPSCRS